MGLNIRLTSVLGASTPPPAFPAPIKSMVLRIEASSDAFFYAQTIPKPKLDRCEALAGTATKSEMDGAATCSTIRVVHPYLNHGYVVRSQSTRDRRADRSADLRQYRAGRTRPAQQPHGLRRRLARRLRCTVVHTTNASNWARRSTAIFSTAATAVP